MMDEGFRATDPYMKLLTGKTYIVRNDLVLNIC